MELDLYTNPITAEDMEKKTGKWPTRKACSILRELLNPSLLSHA